MTEKEAIKERHSVRKYKKDRIEPEKIEKLEMLIEECNKEGNLHLQFVEDAGDTMNKLFNKASGLGSCPSLIACAGPDDETLDERCGFYGQKLVLYAQTLGLNTCWVGTYSKKKCEAEIAGGERLVLVIAVGYGEDNGRVRKSKTAEQVLENVSDLSAMPEWFQNGVEAALLAPTAINQQQFTIAVMEDGTVQIKDKGGVLSKVDLGIVKYNFGVGSDWNGKGKNGY